MNGVILGKVLWVEWSAMTVGYTTSGLALLSGCAAFV